MFAIFILMMVLTLGAQWYLRSTFGTWSKKANTAGLTGRDTARTILRKHGLDDTVAIEQVRGELSDHYDPTKRVVRLSDPIHSQASVAGMAVAAHEVGHALQHANAYAPLQWRSALMPVANIGGQFGPYLAIFGLMLGASGLLNVGIVLFGAAVAFQLVTLPIEFDASRRALAEMRDLGIVTQNDAGGARAVLNAAALTYVAAAAGSVMYLLYFILMARR
ncbi:MAG: zinc metallopeptidase [Trueperaceae bacterium]|nr:zinc metallopeptidase [Trueperaceae bacterium]